MTADRDQHGPTADGIARQLAALGDDQDAEYTDYDLSHALTGWHEATQHHTGNTAGQLHWDSPRGATTINISPQQADRLTQLLNIDTGIHLAHNAATQ